MFYSTTPLCSRPLKSSAADCQEWSTDKPSIDIVIPSLSPPSTVRRGHVNENNTRTAGHLHFVAARVDNEGFFPIFPPFPLKPLWDSFRQRWFLVFACRVRELQVWCKHFYGGRCRPECIKRLPVLSVSPRSPFPSVGNSIPFSGRSISTFSRPCTVTKKMDKKLAFITAAAFACLAFVPAAWSESKNDFSKHPLQNHNLWSGRLFSQSSMVKVRGQNYNRNTVKQTAKNGRKISGDDDVAAGTTSQVPGVQNSRLRNDLEWFRLGVIGSPLQVAYKVIPADREHFESVLWPCMIARWHQRRHKRSHVPFFRRLFDRLPVRTSTSDFHHRILRKKSIRSELIVLGCSFPPLAKTHSRTGSSSCITCYHNVVNDLSLIF